MELLSWKILAPLTVFTGLLNFYVFFGTTFMENDKSWCMQQQIQKVDVLEKLKQDIAETLICHNNTGLAVSIVKDGKKVLSEGFGVTSSSSRIKVTSQTLFSIASVTKSFTAALLLDALTKNGSFNLSSTIREVVGNGFSFSDAQRTEYATIEDLLAHRLQVPSNDEFRFNPQIDRQELLKRVKFFQSKNQFRVKGTYSSTNYIMAAAITELLSNSTWEELIRSTIFEPLGMTSSDFAAFINFNDDSVAPPFSTSEEQFGDIDPVFTKQWNSRCGSGCIFSSADDMVHWMNFHLSGGRNSQGRQVLPELLVDKLFSPRSLLLSGDLSFVHKPEFPVTENGDLYALGWRIGYYRGYPEVFHTGSTPGYASWATLVPSEKLGIFVVMNGDDDLYYYRMSLQNYITDIMLGLEPWLNISTICSFPQPWQPRKASMLPIYDVALKPFRKWADYFGAYRNDGYGDLLVEFNTTLNGLTARFGFGHWQLYPQKTRDVFYGKGLDITNFYDADLITFQADAQSDRIVSLTVHGFSRPLPPVFHRLTRAAGVVE